MTGTAQREDRAAPDFGSDERTFDNGDSKTLNAEKEKKEINEPLAKCIINEGSVKYVV